MVNFIVARVESAVTVAWQAYHSVIVVGIGAFSAAPFSIMHGCHCTQLDPAMVIPEQWYDKEVFQVLRITSEVCKVLDNSAKQKDPEKPKCHAKSLRLGTPIVRKLPKEEQHGHIGNQRPVGKRCLEDSICAPQVSSPNSSLNEEGGEVRPPVTTRPSFALPQIC